MDPSEYPALWKTPLRDLSDEELEAALPPSECVGSLVFIVRREVLREAKRRKLTLGRSDHA
jgi:hypothetical protein